MPKSSPVPSATPQLIPQPRGGALRRGNPGNWGGGRPPDEFRAMCRELACSARDAAQIILKNPNHPAYVGALKWASEHGYGKPKETVEHTGPGGGAIQVVQVMLIGGKEVKF